MTLIEHNEKNLSNDSGSAIPGYREIIFEMGQQLRKRKRIINERIIKVLWPMLALYPVGIFLKYSNFFDEVTFVFIIYFLIFVALIPSIYVGWISGIETYIWIDSYFDKKDLTTAQSWQLAKNVSRDYFKIWLRAYLFPIVAIFSLIVLWIVVLNNRKMISFLYDNPGLYLIGLIISLGVILVYPYKIRLKYRYLEFIFLDKVGESDFSPKKIFEENRFLNEISRGESFKKFLVISLGLDAAAAGSSLLINKFIHSVKLGSMTGEIATAGGNYAKAWAFMSAAFLRSVASYVLYRQARLIAYGEKQKVNNHLYAYLK